MTTSTASPIESPIATDGPLHLTAPARDSGPTPGRDRWLRFAGPVIVLTIAGLAVGRFLLAGSSPSDESATSTARPGSAAPAVDVAVGFDGLRAATEVRPSDPAAWRDYGVAAVREAIRTGDPSYYGIATTALGEATRLAPDDGDTVTAQAVLALSVHDFARALPLAMTAVDLNPLSSAALAALVDANVENGDYPAGEAALRRLLETDPGVAAYARVSYFRQLSGDLPGAQIAMRQAVAAAGAGSERATVLTYLGDISLEMGHLEDADAAYSAALRDQPMSVGASLGRARLLIARGSLIEAAALLDAVVARSPQPAAATLRAELALIMGDSIIANQSFDLVRANDQILRSLGVATDLEASLFNADYGDVALALTEAEAVYESRHTVFSADALAWALLQSGRAAEAVPLVEEALAGGITSPSLRVHAAAVFSAVGLIERARAELATAFQWSPWLALSIRPVAEELATSLGVTYPKGWSS